MKIAIVIFTITLMTTLVLLSVYLLKRNSSNNLENISKTQIMVTKIENFPPDFLTNERWQEVPTIKGSLDLVYSTSDYNPISIEGKTYQNQTVVKNLEDVRNLEMFKWKYELEKLGWTNDQVILNNKKEYKPILADGPTGSTEGLIKKIENNNIKLVTFYYSNINPDHACPCQIKESIFISNPINLDNYQ